MLPCAEAQQVAACTTSTRGKLDAECRMHSALLHAAECTEINVLMVYHEATGYYFLAVSTAADSLCGCRRRTRS